MRTNKPLQQAEQLIVLGKLGLALEPYLKILLAQTAAIYKKILKPLIVRETQAQFAMSAADATEEKAGGILIANEVRIGQYPPQASPPAMTSSTELVKSVRVYFDNRDAQAVKKIMTLASGVAPGTNPDEAQGLPAQKLREEFEIHTEDLKREAVKQFDEELYSVCLGTFQFLCELEPDNCTLRDYLQLTQQLVTETATETRNSTTDSKAPRQRLMPAPENNVGVPKGQSGEATALTFGHTADLEDGQESNQSNRSIEVEGQVDKEVPKAREGHSGLPGSSRNAKRFALLAVVAAVAFAVTLGLWTHRHRQNTATTSLVQIDQPTIDRHELSDLETSAKSLYDQGNLQEASRRCDDILLRDSLSAFALELKERIRGHDIRAARSDNLAQNKHQRSPEESATATGVSASPPKRLLGAAGVTLAASKNPGRNLLREPLMYAVIHDHLVGSCRGNLKISGEAIVFEPAEETRHGFVFKLTDIIGTERGDTLKIKFKHDIYRFKARFAKDKGDNRSKLAAIDQRLTRVRAEVQLAKH